MNVLFVTDPLTGLDASIDASVGMMLATQAAGASVWVCTPEDLAVTQGRVQVLAQRISLRSVARSHDHHWSIEEQWYDVAERRVLDAEDELDLVQLRIDPPVDGRYLHTTYLLDLAEAGGVRVVNRPEGVRAFHEKLTALRYPGLCPATLVTTDTSALRHFVAQHGTAVVKPVDGFAGRDVWLVNDDATAQALLESASHGGRRHVIAQEYLSEVRTGNKRLFVLDGEILGAVTRRPGPEDFRIGPPIASATVDDQDRRIVAALAPDLARHGIAIAGLDVIAGRLIEVNVTCPGGMHKTDALLGTDLSGAIARHLLQRLHQKGRRSA
jgi:glutathione synthase